MEKRKEFVKEAEKLLEEKGKPKFRIATHISKKMLAKEEDLWDFGFGMSIKKGLNTFFMKELDGVFDSVNFLYSVVFDFVKNEVKLEQEPLFIFGRYSKLAPGLCQSRWHCKVCMGRGCEKCGGTGRMYESIEEIIDESFGESKGKGILHASGREDVDVVNLAGRPFVFEIKNWKKIPSLENLKLDKRIELHDLRFVNRTWVKLVSDSHFRKVYKANISFENIISDECIERLRVFDEVLNQKTPIRVLHRRADKIRKRRANVLSVSGSGKEFEIEIEAEQGTYIKELIHGDEGRTTPSFSSVCGVPAVCNKLMLLKIYDSFLDV